MLLTGRRNAQRGQGLLIVLVFLAVFLLVVWTSLTLASGAIINANGVRADSRSTYALDAGVGHTIEWLRNQPGNLCALGARRPPSFVLAYPGRPITVTITALTAPGTCTAARPILDTTVSATGTIHTLTAEVSRPAAVWTISWERFQ